MRLGGGLRSAWWYQIVFYFSQFRLSAGLAPQLLRVQAKVGPLQFVNSHGQKFFRGRVHRLPFRFTATDLTYLLPSEKDRDLRSMNSRCKSSHIGFAHCSIDMSLPIRSAGVRGR